MTFSTRSAWGLDVSPTDQVTAFAVFARNRASADFEISCLFIRFLGSWDAGETVALATPSSVEELTAVSKSKKKETKKTKKTKNNKSGGGSGGGGVTKGQAVPGGRAPGGSLSRAQRSLLRQAGLLDAVDAGLITFVPAPASAPAPAPGPASGEAMDVEMGGVSAPAEHQQQQQQQQEGGGEEEEEEDDDEETFEA
ncbi:hypothetical protein ACSS6W_005032 [Trichoderma asperelloides]